VKTDLLFSRPLLNAAGMLGFAPDPRSAVDWSRFGAFITNPVSLEPRSPARGPRCLPYPGGFLLHTGYPNPGLSRVLRQQRQRWDRADLPIFVHLLASTPGEVQRMVERLEGVEAVVGVEIGLPPEADARLAADFTAAAAVELPVIARLPLERVLALAPAAVSAGAAAVSLGPPRGALPLKTGGSIQGRLYGPGIFPQALAAVQALQREGIPVIAAGGIYRPEQVEQMLQAGAQAVQLDAVLWRGGW
jgi:dihydroorotate dehydrogenase (NAD+) catalytic subunit